MADDKRTTSSERRRRPAPTIDLSATEVSPEPPPSQAADEKQAPPAGDGSGGRRPVLFAVLAGGVAGAAVALAGFWLGGVMQPGNESANDLSSRVAALEAQVKGAPKPADGTVLADLSTRMARLEAAVAKLPAATPDAALTERLAAVENAMKTVGVTLAALNRRVEDSAASVSAARERADTTAKAAESLQTKLDAIEQSAKATQDQVAQTSGVDVAARRALAAAALREAVVRGAPYSAELAVVKQLGADTQSVAALEPFAASGVPTEAASSRELDDLLPSMIKAAGADASKAGGFFERLQANAGRLVRIRPLDAPAGDDASAVLARIEVKAAHHDLAGIDGELDRLPPNLRALAEPWRKKLAARNAAIAASRKLAAAGAAALGSP